VDGGYGESLIRSLSWPATNALPNPRVEPEAHRNPGPPSLRTWPGRPRENSQGCERGEQPWTADPPGSMHPGGMAEARAVAPVDAESP